jgi:hypothetical protein
VSLVRVRTKRLAGSSPEAHAIEVVDGALMFAGRRKIFTVGEALQLLQGVENKVDETTLTLIAPIANTAEDSYREDDLVDRSRVVDPLLDMRLALSD